MESEYSFEKKENYLMMTITGKYAKEDFMSYAQIILERCERENIKKVLVDTLKVANTNVDTMDRYYMGEHFAKVLGYKVKRAVLWPEEHITKFAENVAVNRGAILLVTHSFKVAEDWLLNNTG